MQIPDRRTTAKRKVIEVTESMRKRRFRPLGGVAPCYSFPSPTLRAKVAEFILERQCRDAEKARSANTDE
jgi:hypothetical protein